MLRKARFEIREFLISMELSGGRGLEDRYRNPLARSVFLAAPMAGLRGHVKRDALSSSFLSRVLFLNAPPHLTDPAYGGFVFASDERQFLPRKDFIAFPSYDKPADFMFNRLILAIYLRFVGAPR